MLGTTPQPHDGYSSPPTSHGYALILTAIYEPTTKQQLNEQHHGSASHQQRQQQASCASQYVSESPQQVPKYAGGDCYASYQLKQPYYYYHGAAAFRSQEFSSYYHCSSSEQPSPHGSRQGSHGHAQHCLPTSATPYASKLCLKLMDHGSFAIPFHGGNYALQSRSVGKAITAKAAAATAADATTAATPTTEASFFIFCCHTTTATTTTAATAK